MRVTVFAGSSMGSRPEYAGLAAGLGRDLARAGIGVVYGGSSAGLMGLMADAAMTAEILTWSRSRGLFAGVSLSGATLREDSDWNNELYGRKITNREIITSTIAPPAGAKALLDELNRYSSRK